MSSSARFLGRLIRKPASPRHPRSPSAAVVEFLEERPLLATIDVTTFADTLANDGKTSLREAVITANAASGDTLIRLPAGTYTLARANPFTVIGPLTPFIGEDASRDGDLDITNAQHTVTIVGVGAARTLIKQSFAEDRVLHVLAGASLRLNDVTVTGGRVVPNLAVGAVFGGGIYNAGTLSVSRSVISGNAAALGSTGSAWGGGLASSGVLSMIDSTIADNSAYLNGGGLWLAGVTTATLTRTTLLRNRAVVGWGGGISEEGGTVTTFTDGTISGNSAAVGGGGVAFFGGNDALTVHRSTLTGNKAGTGGGLAVGERAGKASVTESTISNNSATDGAGILSRSLLTVASSTVSGNIATGSGGGLLAESNSNVTVRNSTVSGNSAKAGGGIAVRGRSSTVSVVHSTIATNSAETGGGVDLLQLASEYTVTRQATGSIPIPVFDRSRGRLLGVEFSRTLLAGTAKEAGSHTHTGNTGGVSGRTSVAPNHVHQFSVPQYVGSGLTLPAFTELTSSAGAHDHGVVGNSILTAGTHSHSYESHLTTSQSFSGAGLDPFLGPKDFSIATGDLLTNSVTHSHRLPSGSSTSIVSHRHTVTPAWSTETTFRYAPPMVLKLDHVLVAGNAASKAAPDLHNDGGEIAAGSSYNLVGDAGSAAGLANGANGNIVGADWRAVIDPVLRNNGGPTATHRLLPGGRAIDAGGVAPGLDQDGTVLISDQRGGAFLRLRGARVDIGAFEAAAAADMVAFYRGEWRVGTSTGGGFESHRWAQWDDVPWDALRHGDFDGDGRGDVLGLLDGGWVVGRSTGSAFATSVWGRWANVSWKDVTVGDVNGDGKADILARLGGTWWTALSTGTQFAAQVRGAVWSDLDWQHVSLVDLNGDRRADLLANLNGGWWAALSTGSTFGAASRWAQWANLAWQALGTFDANGDGGRDLYGLANGTWWVGLSTGNSFLTSQRAVWSNAIWRDAVAGDFDGDGRDDLAARLGGGLVGEPVRFNRGGGRDESLGDLGGLRLAGRARRRFRRGQPGRPRRPISRTMVGGAEQWHGFDDDAVGRLDRRRLGGCRRRRCDGLCRGRRARRVAAIGVRGFRFVRDVLRSADRVRRRAARFVLG